MSALLEISDLTARLGVNGPRVLDSVSLDVAAREIVGIVGESGSGKSTLALSLMGLLAPAIMITGGAARFRGIDLLGLSAQALRAHRGRDLAMIFQEPMTSLNPVMRIGGQIAEVLRRHQGVTPEMARRAAVNLLEQVEFPDPKTRIDCFPHELSGGQRQRVMIAIALAGKPRILIADEPTTALDVTIQAQILALLRKLRDAHDMAVLLITHDLGVVAELCDRVAIMYMGAIVEVGTVETIFDAAAHPYTLGLLSSRPRIAGRSGRLVTIAGTAPAPGALPEGCAFAPRCPSRMPACAAPPALRAVAPGHQAACHLVPA